MGTFQEQFSKLELSRQFSGVKLPSVEINPEYRKKVGAKLDDSNTDILKSIVRTGLRKGLKNGIIPREKLDIYVERIKKELDTIISLRFTDYFLILWDFIEDAKSKKIPLGRGRGSAAGSLILFLMGVTGIDPIKYGLLFERFISPSRCKYHEINGEVYLTGSLPDIDEDCCFLRRHEIVEYLDKKYPNRTAKILNITTLTGKNLIKECGKIVYGKSESEMHQISELIPSVFGVVQDIAKVYKEDSKFKDWCDANSKAYDIALHLRDLIKNKSVHASGLVISRDEITELCPVEFTGNKELVCSYNMADSGEFMIKFDLLGLKTLTVIDETCKLAGIEFDSIDCESPEIYKYLRESKDFYGLFQLEGGTAYKATKQIMPDNIYDLSAIMALGRPGSLSLIKDYKESKDTKVQRSLHPLVDPILKNTWGYPIYQENLMMLCHTIGFSLEEGYLAIKVVAKKLANKVAEWEKKIYDKASENGFDKKIADVIWIALRDGAGYSFNFSHSCSYSFLAASTVFLKLKYPKEFFLGALKMTKYKPKPFEAVSEIVAELPNFGIKLLPPDFAKANEDFQLDKEGIRFGLSSIHGISEASIEKLKNFKLEGKNKFEMFESAKQAKVGIAVLSSLIQAGALSGFNLPRTKLVLEAQLWNLLTGREKAYCLERGEEYGFDLVKMIKSINSWTSNSNTETNSGPGQQPDLFGEISSKKPTENKPLIKASRFETIKRNYEPFKKIFEQNSRHEDFCSWTLETKLLGFSYSTTLKKIFEKVCKEVISISEFEDMPQKATGIFVGTVETIKSARAKNDKMYSRITLRDEGGALNCFIWSPRREQLLETKVLPKEGEIYAIKGTKNGDSLSVIDYSNQGCKIYTKFSDLKEIEN